MPSTFDPLLRLELQATGENATTWGVKTNTNLDLIAESIAGAVTLNVAGSGDYTLSTANGAEDEARQAILILTGTLTGNRNIIVPSSPKNYTVINNTTGAFTVTLKQSAGSGVVIPTTGPTITVCTSTTCVDSIGATAYTKSLLVATSAEPARNTLGLANTATIVATSVGTSLITAVDTSAARSAIGAAASGGVTTSGLTMSTARILGRTTAATGAVEEISIGSGLTLSAGSLGLSPAATSQFRSQLFTSSSSWTAPSGVTEVRVVVIGGGGGGGGYGAGGDGQGGQTGGVGGIAVGTLTVSPGTSYTVTVGTGGTGGAARADIGVAGTAGGTSSFSTISATGGGGGGGGNAQITVTNGSGSGGNLRNTNMTITRPMWFDGGNARGGGTTPVAWTIDSTLHPGAAGGGGGSAGVSGSGGVNGVVYIEWAGV